MKAPECVGMRRMPGPGHKLAETCGETASDQYRADAKDGHS